MAGLVRIPWHAWLPLPWRKWRPVLRVENGDEIPERLPAKGAVLVGGPEEPRWIAFACPCDADHSIMLNLDPSRAPYWIVRKLKPLTITPSVDYLTPSRRCHFWVREGRIVWVPDEDESGQHG